MKRARAASKGWVWIVAAILLLGLFLWWKALQTPLPVYAAQQDDPSLAPPPASSWTLGSKRLLVLPVAFPDASDAPVSPRSLAAWAEEVRGFYSENSYGAFTLEPVLAPVLMMPRATTDYALDPDRHHALRQDALEVARQAGYPWEEYDLDVVLNNELFEFRAEVAARGCWLQGLDPHAAIHELGHNLGLGHANLWIGRGDTIIGPGRMKGYGNRFDAMSDVLHAPPHRRHFNAAHKAGLGWLAPRHIQLVETSGVYRLDPFDVASLDADMVCALVITRPDGRRYWIERRTQTGDNPRAEGGVLLYFGAWNESYGVSPLLDMTPNSCWEDDSRDAPLLLGRTFSDPAAGLHITPLARPPSRPASIDLQVTWDAAPSNQAPLVSLNLAAATLQPGEPLTLQAQAHDPDGDSLSLSWELGDATFQGDRKTVRKSWSEPGDYTVRCWVSDRRGGVSCASARILVGQPGTWRISGRITVENEPLAGARISLTESNVAYTDANGRYTATGLGPGTYQLHPGHGYHEFTPRSRVVTIENSNLENVDFEASWTATPNNPPYVVLRVPAQPGPLAAPADVALQALAYDDGIVQRVQFESPGELGLFGVVDGYSGTWTNVWLDAPEGSHVITARAVDDLGLEGAAPPSLLTILPPPPRLDAISRGTNGAMHLRATGPAGANLTLESSIDLRSWTPIEHRTNAPEQTLWVDPNAPGSQRRFYRLQMQ